MGRPVVTVTRLTEGYLDRDAETEFPIRAEEFKVLTIPVAKVFSGVGSLGPIGFLTE